MAAISLNRRAFATGAAALSFSTLGACMHSQSARAETPQTRARALVQALDLGAEYPFSPHFIETPMGAMHYVDEGSGAPVVMLHGNPTWSFLYREFIKDLSTTHRAIAPDHIGFGLSDKPTAVDAYSLRAHIDNFERLLVALDLQGVTLIVQDWGGPIGLGAAARQPQRIRALMILNTFGFYPPADGMDPENLPLPLPLRMMRTQGIGSVMVRNLGMFERVAMPQATARLDRLRVVQHAYRGVFRDASERAGVLAFPRMIPTNTRHPSARILMEETGPYLDGFRGPARIFWGMQDPFFPVAALEAWKRKLPQAEVTELADAKHYVQEDAYETIIPGVRAFLA